MIGLLRQEQNPAYRTLRLHEKEMKIRFATALQLVAALLLAVAVAQSVYFARVYMRLPKETPQETPEQTKIDNSPAAEIPADAWLTIRAAGRQSAGEGPLAEKFRLAGTFFLYDEASETGESQERRRAILDDLSAKSQIIAQENQEVDGYLVTRIEEDRVRLQRDGVEYELALSFSAVSTSSPAGQSAATKEGNLSMEDMPALESNRFGKRVGENRWVMKREELLRYYAELLDDPERIANVYASLKPDYKDKEIEGYYLDTEGEGDFFRAVGLQEGDVIRRVNSMRMVSQRRAEYFITEFMKNRVNALVLDVERGGAEQKLIYLIR